MKSKKEMTEEKHLKKEKRHKNGKASVQKRTCVIEGNLTDLDPELESCVRADEKAGKKKRKEKNDTNCLVNAKSDEEMSKTKKKKKKKQVGDNEVEAPLTKIPEVNNKKTKKSKCTNIEHAEIEVEEEELPKKVKKKRKKPGEQKKEKKNNTADRNASDDIDAKPVPKKHKKSKLILSENQETSEETGDVEGVKKSKMTPTPEDINKTKKKKHENTVSLVEINDVKKNKNKSKSGDMNVEEEKRQKNKARKTSVECADVEETKLRKKKKSKQDEEQQSEENVDTRTDRKNRKRKECATTAEAPAEAPCSENGMKKKKKKKVKEEVDDQNVSKPFKKHLMHFQDDVFCFSHILDECLFQEQSQVDVVFLSVKNGNADEVTHDQVSQALFIFIVSWSFQLSRNGKLL